MIAPVSRAPPSVHEAKVASMGTSKPSPRRAVDSTRVDPSAKAYYDRAFPIYRQLYRDLRESFQSISSLVAYHAEP